MNQLYSILWKDQSRAHLFWAFLGTLAGFVLLLAGIQFYKDIKSVLSENSDLLDPEYIVINKQVNLGQTLGFAGTGFSEEELEELKQQPFADQVSPFISNQFPVQYSWPPFSYSWRSSLGHSHIGTDEIRLLRYNQADHTDPAFQ